MTPAEALRAGLHRIRTVGWRQGSATDRWSGPRCMQQSLPWYTPIITENEARSWLTRVVQPHHIVGYNDTPGRTQAEVEAVYERAIALAEAEERK